MDKHERERIEAQIKEELAKADAGADSVLDRLKASKWTAAMLLGAAVVVIVVLLSLF